MSADEAGEKLVKLIESFGVTMDDAGPGAHAVDFNNAIIGDPYITGTGYLADRQTAEGVANIILPLINEIATMWLDENPDKEAHLGWTHPRAEAAHSWARVSSRARKGWNGDPNEGDPVYEEQYEGDEWFMASVELGMIDATQREMLDKINEAIRTRTEVSDA